MASRKHQDYLTRALMLGFSEDQAEAALVRVRAGAQGHVSNLYESALQELSGPGLEDRREDARRILEDRGVDGSGEVADVIAGLLGRMGLSVGPDGRPVAAAGGSEDLPGPDPVVRLGDVTGAVQQFAPFMADPAEQQYAQSLLGPLVDAFRARPGRALTMSEIGPVVGAGPEQAVALGIALGHLVDDGHLVQSSSTGPAGPTWTLKAGKGQEDPAGTRGPVPVPAEVIAASLSGYLVPGHPYPTPLPADLAPWHCYTTDGGHSILVALGKDQDLPHGPGIKDCLVPAPVKAVLRAGWTLREGYLLCDLPYDPDLGLVTDPADDEFDSPARQPAPGALHGYVVGEPYNKRISPEQWQAADGSGQLRLVAGGAQFFLPISGLRPAEIEAFRRGNAEFAIVPQDRLLVFLYRFTDPATGEGTPWSDAPWMFHVQNAVEPVALGEPGTGLPLHLVLVEATTGLIAAMRLISIPAEAADVLRAAAARQRELPNNPGQADADLAVLYRKYQTKDLLTRAEGRFEALRDGT